jgi:hypothetical protein
MTNIIQTIKKVFASLNYRFFFFFTGLLFLFLLPYLSKDAGISGDEEKHHRQAVNVYNYFNTSGKDTSALYNINSRDPMQFNGQSFDVITYYIEKKFDVDNIYEMRHIFNALVGWLIILFAGLITKELIGWGGGIVTMVLLFITPFFLGHSYNNNKDIPLALGFIMSIYYIIIYFRQFPKPKLRIIFLVSLSIAIAISIRIAGILIIAYLGIYAILFIIKENYLKKENIKNLKKLILQLLGISVFGYFLGILIWPFALRHPIDNAFIIFQAMKNFPVALGQIFEGNIIWSIQIPWYYVSKYILITVPVVIIFGFALFIFFIKRFVNKKNWLEIFIIVLSVIFPVIFSSFNNNNDYGGWRHLLFIYPSIVICSVLGFYALQKIINNNYIRFIVIFIVALGCIKPVLHIIRNHPLEYVYYNEFAGGVNKAYTNYEMDYFQNSPRIASEWLLKHIKEKGVEKNHKIVIASNCSVGYYFRHDTAIISTLYCNFDRKSHYDWDYMIACNTYIDPYRLRNNYYPPDNTIYQLKVDTAPVCVVIERIQKCDYQAYKYSQSKDFSKAYEFYNMAITFEPKNKYVILDFIQCCVSNKDPITALNTIDYFMSIYPNDPNAMFFKGIVFMNTNRIPEAIALFQNIVQNINPRYSQAYYNLGCCYLNINEYDKALASFKNCIAIESQNKGAYEYIVKILMFQNKTEEANKIIEMTKKL